MSLLYTLFNIMISLFTTELDNSDLNRNISKLTKLSQFKIIIERQSTKKARHHPRVSGASHTDTHLCIVCILPAASNVAWINSPQIAISHVNDQPSVPYVPEHTPPILKVFRHKITSNHPVSTEYKFAKHLQRHLLTRSKKLKLNLGLNRMLKPLFRKTLH